MLRVSACWSTSSLSLSDLFWLPAHAPCLLYYSSPQSCNAQSLCPLVHFISLSLRPFLAPCTCSMSALLQFSSELQCSESLPVGPLHLSLSQTFSGSLRMLHVCSTTVLLRAALSELQRSESLPAGPLPLSLSLRPFLAPCACSVSALL